MFEVNNTYDYSSYRIGQNCIITSGAVQPKLAEVADLTTMEIGATSVYPEMEGPYTTVKRVGPGGHINDPFLEPVGDVPLMLFMALAVGYMFFKKYKQKMSRNA